MRLILAACRPRHGRRRGDPRRPARLVGRPRGLPPRRPRRRPDAPGREPRSGPRPPPEPMSVGVLERPATGSAPESTTGGVPARRAMIRWAWRLFRREWRQQLLILLLVIVAVAAVVVGAAVAVNTPPPANAGFGTADGPGHLHELREAHRLDLHSAGRPDRRAGAPLRHGPGHRERDAPRPRQHPDVPTPVPGPPRPLRRADAPAALRPLPDRAEPDRPHARAGVRPQPAGGRHLAPGRQDGRRHRAEPPEPARRVRAGSPGPGDAPDPGERALRRTGRGPGPHRVQRLDAGSASATPTRSIRRPSCWRWRRSACC